MPNVQREIFTNQDIVVYWLPQLCNRCDLCTANLPSVFNLNDKPWIRINAAKPTHVLAACAACPSGALTAESLP